MVCLWPGLPQLWLRGAWSGLALAVGFTALVNFLLAATFVWTAWLSVSLLWAGWFTVLVVWIVSAYGAKPAEEITVDSPPTLAATELGGQDLLSEVYTQYLQGNWFEAETVLEQMLVAQPRDPEALLLLATLQRHTERWDEAEATLKRLEKLDEAVRWKMEIAAEYTYLEQLKTEQTELEEAESVEAEQPVQETLEERVEAA